MSITSYAGEQLLQVEILEAIKKEADLLLLNKDVAGAWQASRHIKEQLAALPPDQVKPVLNDYRHLTTDLKVLALPLLDEAEVKSLLINNLSFLDAKYGPALAAALPAWLATVATAEQAAKRDELMKLLPPDSPARANLAAGPAPARPASPPAASINPVQALAMNTDVLLDKHEAAELAGHIKKVNDMGGAPLALAGGATAAENIFNLSASSQDKAAFLRRANALIASRLRDVRTKTGLREYLGRPFPVGGLGLTPEILDKASGLIEDEYNKLHSSEPKMPKPEAGIAKAVAAAVMEAPLPARPAPRPEPASIKPPEAIVQKIEPPPAPKIAPAPLNEAPRVAMPIRSAPPASDKPRLEDIKPAPARGLPRTVTAADELQLLTLADWRQYGAPDEAVKNILQKIQLLGQESVNSKAQGIKMFRASELFQQYVALGRATLAQGKKLADALADKAVNPDNMTQDEFFAVALLNGKLK